MADKEDKDSVDEQWVDDVVAKALERSIENAPEFLPNDIENSAYEKPSGSTESPDEEDANIDYRRMNLPRFSCLRTALTQMMHFCIQVLR